MTRLEAKSKLISGKLRDKQEHDSAQIYAKIVQANVFEERK